MSKLEGYRIDRAELNRIVHELLLDAELGKSWDIVALATAIEERALKKLEGPKTFHVVHQAVKPARPGYLPSPAGPVRSFMTEEEIRAKWPERADAILEDARRLGYAWIMDPVPDPVTGFLDRLEGDS